MRFLNDFRSEILQVSLIPGLRPARLEVLLDPNILDGIILQSFGAGNVPNLGDYSFVPFIRKARKLGIATIIASQFPANSTMDTVYEPGLKAIEAGAIPTGNMTNAAATAKFRWVLARVKGLIAAGEISSSEKIAWIDNFMTEAYVGEMDTAGPTGRRTPYEFA
jgi:L-asparaginase